MHLLHPDPGEDRAAVSPLSHTHPHTCIYENTHTVAKSHNYCGWVTRSLEVLMQSNVMSSECDEISDMHKKVLRVSLSTSDL